MSEGSIALRIPQVLNAALAACVIICGAQRTPYLIEHVSEWNLEFAAETIYILIIANAWNLKNYIDEYRGFEAENLVGFNLARTVIFGAMAYFMLAVVVSNSGSIHQNLLAAIFFMALVAWSFVSAVSRIFIREGRYDIENVERLNRRIRWVLIYAICMILTYFIGRIGSIIGSTLIFSMVIVFFVYDICDAGTFKVKHNGIV